ncbi:TPA: hypothetical protein N0F65_001717, partial [Lagenidium giganteum]
MLHRPNGFRIFCDHANLIQVFAPSKEIKQHIRGKLQRWALRLVEYHYTLEHIAGEDNVWADIVKRVTTLSELQTSQLRPLQDEEFVWPTQAQIRAAQLRHKSDLPVGAHEIDGLWRMNDKVWIPSSDKELVTRLVLVAHCGIQGHRGEHVTIALLQRKFTWQDMRAVVKRMLKDCLICKHVKGGLIVMRDWETDTVATRRNECIHLDFLFMGESYGETTYVLVLKDELTHYCE